MYVRLPGGKGYAASVVRRTALGCGLSGDCSGALPPGVSGVATTACACCALGVLTGWGWYTI